MKITKKVEEVILDPLVELNYSFKMAAQDTGDYTEEFIKSLIRFSNKQRKQSNREEGVYTVPNILLELWSVDGTDRMILDRHLKDICETIQDALQIAKTDLTVIARSCYPSQSGFHHYISGAWRIFPNCNDGVYLQVVSPFVEIDAPVDDIHKKTRVYVVDRNPETTLRAEFPPCKEYNLRRINSFRGQPLLFEGYGALVRHEFERFQTQESERIKKLGKLRQSLKPGKV